MKKITWQKCEAHGVFGPKSSKYGPMTIMKPEMLVSARYQDFKVYLRIKSIIKEPNVFCAVVAKFHHESDVHATTPTDLSINDEVEITGGPSGNPGADICFIIDE